LEYMYVNRCIYLPPKKSARSCPPNKKMYAHKHTAEEIVLVLSS
jgi:hypothetical protein